MSKWITNPSKKLLDYKSRRVEKLQDHQLAMLYSMLLALIC